MLNKTTMMGRLTHDPELRRTQTDTPVCSFSIACERDFKNADGGRDTDFFDCVAWRQTAEFVSQYFTEGHKRRATELIVSNVYFGDSKPKEEGDGAPPAYAGTPMSIAGGGIPANFTPNFADFQEDGELPF